MTGAVAALAASNRPAITASIGAGTGSGSCTIVSGGQCTATKNWPAVVSGGSGSYSYSWAFLSNPGNCSLTNVNSQTCTVTRTGAAGSYGYTLQLVVSDTIFGVGDSVNGTAQTMTIST